MPVSSPSYFPPERTPDVIIGLNAGFKVTNCANMFLAGQSAGQYADGLSDIVVIGHNALSAGTALAPLNDTSLDGTIAIGSQALAAHTTASYAGANYSNVAIGYKAAATMVAGYNNVFIGHEALANSIGSTTLGAPPNDNVVIGAGAALNINELDTFSFDSSVVIGAKAAQGSGVNNGLETSVVIGAGAGGAFNKSSQLNNVVFLGYQAGYNASSDANIYIGVQAGYHVAGANNIVVGGAGAGGSDSTAQDNIYIGNNVGNLYGNYNVCIGDSASNSAASSYNVLIGAYSQINGAGSDFNVIIGPYANNNNNTVYSYKFILESNKNAPLTQQTLLFGDFEFGSLILGNSTQGTNRDFGGTGYQNILKIINGTPGNANPLGGGYFYASAGALHWVGSNGTDTQIAPA